MNKQERKECQYSDYYRMTGEGYHTGLRCLKKPLSFSSFGIYVLVSKMSAKINPFSKIYTI